MTVAPSQRQVMALMRNGHRWAPEKPGEPFFFYQQPFWPAYLTPALLGNANLCSPALHMVLQTPHSQAALVIAAQKLRQRCG